MLPVGVKFPMASNISKTIHKSLIKNGFAISLIKKTKLSH